MMKGLYTTWEIAKMFNRFFGGDSPCNFNSMDEKTDEWCAEHCGRVTETECWEHAIKKGWF